MASRYPGVMCVFFFQAEDGIRDGHVTGVQTCALPISLWACKDEQNDKLTLPFVGLERANWQYRIGSLLRLGTRVAFGSDWPVSSADPLQELHVAVNRMLSARLGAPG